MLVERLRVFVYINRQALGLIIYCCSNSNDVKIDQLDFTTSYNYSWSHGISSTMQQSPDLRPPMTIIADKLVKLVESTGLQKISTTQHLEVDAQDPSFITTRPYFEPSSTGISLDSASYFCLSSCHYSYQSLDTLIIFISQSGWNRELHIPVMNACSSPILPGLMLPYLLDGTPKYLEFSTVSHLFPHFLPMPIGDGQSCCVKRPDYQGLEYG